MTAAATAAAGQLAALALMTDTCTIVRRSPGRTFDPTSMSYSAATTPVYSGACRFRPAAVRDRVVEAGEEPTSLWDYLVSVPLTAQDIRPDDEVRLTLSADPSISYRRLRVVAIVRGTHVTARRLKCIEEETQAPYGRAYPSESLYPSLTLYPNGV